MNLVNDILAHVNFIGAMALFVIGLYMVVTHSNLIKRIMGINIMGTAIFYFFIAVGNVEDGAPPLLDPDGNALTFINPLPSVLILTGIVVVVSITVYSLSLVVRIYETYGTIDQKEMAQIEAEDDD